MKTKRFFYNFLKEIVNIKNIKLAFVTLSFLLSMLFNKTFAQMSINTTGAEAHPSAGLDIDFSNKGLLIPRVALSNNTDATTIPSPATGLMVYNTGTGGLSLAGYYYNAGTSSSPNWVHLSTTGLDGSGTANYVTKWTGTSTQGNSIIYDNGTNVGIGTISPAEKLHINGSVRGDQSGALRISTGSGYIDIGPKNTEWAHFYTDRSRYWFSTGLTVETGNIGSYNENLSLQTSGTTQITVLNSNGNVGIGTTSPTQKLEVDGNVLATSFKGTGNYRNVWSSWGNSIWLERNGHDGIFYNDPTSHKGFMIGFHGTNDIMHIGHTTDSWSTGSYLGVITGAGKVGIKTSSPSCELHIAGRTYSTVSSSDPAIRGENTYDDGICRGIRGEARGSSSSIEKYGVQGYATGAGTNYGVWGSAQGSATLNIAVYGNATGASTNWAGYFAGNVNVTGSLSKGGGSFLIDHPLDPLNKTLRHNFVESPENLCLYRGKVKLNENGEAVVRMPDYFAALTKEKEATVSPTPVGRPFMVGYEWNKDFTEFILYGEPNREVTYIVLSDRDDPVIHELYKPVEEEKGNGNFTQGKLLYPKAYGYPKQMGVNYDEKFDE